MNWTRCQKGVEFKIYIHNEISFVRDARRETNESFSICSSRTCWALAMFRSARVELNEQLQLSRLNSMRVLIILDLTRNIILSFRELVLKRPNGLIFYLLLTIASLMRRHRHVSLSTKSSSRRFRNCTIRYFCCYVLRSLYPFWSQLYRDEIFFALEVFQMCSLRKIMLQFLVRDFEQNSWKV